MGHQPSLKQKAGKSKSVDRSSDFCDGGFKMSPADQGKLRGAGLTEALVDGVGYLVLQIPGKITSDTTFLSGINVTDFSSSKETILRKFSKKRRICPVPRILLSLSLSYFLGYYSFWPF